MNILKSRIRAFIPLGIFLALAGLLFYGLGQDPKIVPSPLIGKPAPDFSLPALQDSNQIITRDILVGKISLVNVWASWCPSCREEHEELMRIAQENLVQIVGLNWKDTRPEALQMLQQQGNPYGIVLFDSTNRAGIDWGVYGAPETFVIDRAGIIRYKQIGPLDNQVWEKTIRPLIEQLR